jgi:quinone-modifying oxidoreductase subunit QmoC
LAIVVVERLKPGKLAPRSGYSDWLFIAVIGMTVVTGAICQAARLANAPFPAYAWYFAHLLFVFFLLVYLPYSKFAHLLYRTAAMMYCRYSGREAGAVPSPGDQETVEEQPAA